MTINDVEPIEKRDIYTVSNIKLFTSELDMRASHNVELQKAK